MKKFIAVVFIVLSRFCLLAQDIPPEHLPRQRTFDVLHYQLNISVDEKSRKIYGKNTITLIPIKPKLYVVRLDAAELDISDVSIGWRGLKYEVNKPKEELLITLNKPYTPSDTIRLTIVYTATPQKGLYFIQPDDAYPNKQWQVWSQGEAEDNHYWFPCYDYPDDKATSEMTVTVNQKFVAISNGKLLEIKFNETDHTKTFHWFESKPHSSYLISLVAGTYEQIKDEWNQVPVYYYVYKGQKNLAPLSFANTPKMMRVFSDVTGIDYPWEKYSQTIVSDFMFGGMENVSAATLTEETIHDKRAHLDYKSDGLIAHELAHQWFGDLITCKDWSNAWLNEGFATFFGTYFLEADTNADEAEYRWYTQQQNVILSDVGDQRRSIVANKYFYPMDVFDSRIYSKGSSILNMLRYIVGDDVFFKAIRNYTKKNAYGLVETTDLETAFEETAGENLQWFFDQWVYRSGYPEFDVKYEWDPEQRIIKLKVTQIQALDSLTGIFTTPIDIEIWTNQYPQTQRILIDKTDEEFLIPCENPPKNVVFDKGNKVLKKINIEKTSEEWMFQLKNSGPVDRLLAVKMLAAKTDETDVKQALSKALFSDKCWFIRVEAASALGNSTLKSNAELLIDAYRDKNPDVRSAVLNALSNFHGHNIIRFLKNVFEQDTCYEVMEAALNALVKVDPQNVVSYCEKGLTIESHRNKIVVASIRNLAETGTENAYKVIFPYTKYGMETAVRGQAILSLSENWPDEKDVLETADKMSNEQNYYIRMNAYLALEKIGNEEAIKSLKNASKSEKQARLLKIIREALRRLIYKN